MTRQEQEEAEKAAYEAHMQALYDEQNCMQQMTCALVIWTLPILLNAASTAARRSHDRGTERVLRP